MSHPLNAALACEKIIEEELALHESEKQRMMQHDIDLAKRMQNQLNVEEIKEELPNEDLQPPQNNDHVLRGLQDSVGPSVYGWEDVN